MKPTWLARLIAVLFLTSLAACGAKNEKTPSNPTQNSPAETEALADTVFINGRIYTANADRQFASAMAVNGDEIIAIGDDAAVNAFIGPDTNTVDLVGKLVLPGLHDTHLHAIGAMPIDSCDLENVGRTLEEIVEFVSDCTERASFADEEWIAVELWNFAAGNQPGELFKTLRQALDAISTEKPVILLGSDGHHYGVNSVALARAVTQDGDTVGLTAATLESEFADLIPYVGVDEAGEPNGRLTEDYPLMVIGADKLEDELGLAQRRASPELLMEVTLPRGITSFLEAAADPDTLDIFDKLVASGGFYARAHLALHFDPDNFTDDDGEVSYEHLLAEAIALRRKYENVPNIDADFLKLFADGVLEGDPLADPPTLPNAAFSRDFLQPKFVWDDDAQWVKVAGYVDTASPQCVSVRDAIAIGQTPDVAEFKAANGYHPMQCALSNGTLRHAENVIMDYVREGDAAGFTFHIHAIGDRTVETALNAIEAARKVNGSANRHIITHLQVVRPQDRARFADNDAFASFTFAWATGDPQYDTTVFPFIDRADGPAGIYDPNGYYFSNVYPAESIRVAGGIVIAGSDAPVDTKDPRPFINIGAAVTRAFPGRDALNINEAISIFDAVDAYTINAARALKQDAIAGSLEPGKKADFIILDRDIFDLADRGETDPIFETRVEQTWFAGKKVYQLGE